MAYAAVVGTFDGVHRGHRFLLDDLSARAAKAGLTTRVYTFTDHPLSVLRPDRAPLLLSTADEKRSQLESYGIGRIDIDDFASMSSLTAREYITRLASDGVTLLLIGYDNRFGSDGLTTLRQFAGAAHGAGVTVEQAAELTDSNGMPVNSSRIRRLLTDGKIRPANDLLGYEYSITGTVVKGKQLGRTIGFPTANIELTPGSRKLLPPNGVYACRALLGTTALPAMVNIGHRPTVDAPDAPVSIEANIIDAATDSDNAAAIATSLDLYDKNLTLKFVERLRPEQRFPSLDALRAQLANDRLAAINATRR